MDGTRSRWVGQSVYANTRLSFLASEQAPQRVVTIIMREKSAAQPVAEADRLIECSVAAGLGYVSRL